MLVTIKCFFFYGRHKLLFAELEAAARYNPTTGDLFLFPITFFRGHMGDEFADSLLR